MFPFALFLFRASHHLQATKINTKLTNSDHQYHVRIVCPTIDCDFLLQQSRRRSPFQSVWMDTCATYVRR